MSARLNEFCREPMRRPHDSMSNARFSRIWPARAFAQERRGEFTHRKKLAARVGSDPDAISGRKAIHGVI